MSKVVPDDKVVPDHTVYADLQRLIEMQLHANEVDFLPRQVTHSVLAGRHSSRLRGRGLSFEELRAYRVGDDIRTLDWKVTNRTRKPHVRVYTEERERDVIILVDQRSHMFFGSQVQMKSVTAADVAALAVWRVLSVKDRVGALVFNDNSITKIKPQRSRKTAMQILQSILQMNHQLGSNQSNQNAMQLNHVLHQAERLCGHDCMLILISDLDGWNQQCLERIKRIKAHNDLIVSFVVDPLEQSLPPRKQLLISDGDLQISINTEADQLNDKFADRFSARFDSLRSELSEYAVPMSLIDTITPAYQQLHTLGRGNEQ
ncbi:MAG: hypothetical protein ACI9LY_001832 [Arenicella sp.]|jgi:uncharacterized protein (DUF58 family)